MEMSGLMGGFYRVSVFVSRLAYINILWVLFTLLGLVIFGFMPATVAMFAVTRKGIRGANDISVFKMFWQTYKKEFVKANLFGVFFVFIGYIIYANFVLLAEQIVWMQIVRYLLLVLTVVYSLTLLMFFPVYVHYDVKPIEKFKVAVLLTLSYPQYIIFMAVSVVAVQYLVMYIPGLIPFFTCSLIAFILTKIANIVFKVVSDRHLQNVTKNEEHVQVY
ncbi:YesL family protein [Bacillus sp. JCM 19034]|uniref:YesL family protein n=1 Tax=Bacillus sp. JCM 19034 TaxID=1481928 RepID=UPI0007828AAF|nr:YesL family protein [Bacillus sp. JCM 19034]